MRARRPVSFFRSVRFRIAALTTLAVAVAATAALIGLRQAFYWTLLHEVDRVLLEDVAEVTLVINELSPEGLDAIADELTRKAAGHKQHRWFARLLDQDGDRVWRSSDAEGTPPAPAKADAVPRTVGDLRTLRAATPTNPLGIASVQVGSSMSLYNDDLELIDRLVAGAVAMILIVAPLCGYWLAGIATRDLEAMTAKASSLRPTQLNERLPYRGVDDEFDRLADTINHLLARIATFVDERRTFLADAAHELRTPIAAIRSSIEVALGGERSRESYRDLMEQVLDESESLEVLVNQVLLLSEANATVDRAEPERVLLDEVAAKAADMFAGVAESRGIRLECDIAPDIAVNGIRRHLHQVASNLLDNAIKYTPEGGRVQLTLSDADGVARLEVADNGVGVSPEDLPRLFERFFRADRARQRDDTRGSGLGLSICQSIVEAHGGEITCKSRAGEGTTLTVQLPLAVDS
ncbi:sensor histidine kinase [Botrimarina mediterranea]|uniref:histidine kinase n=1 Tax=Botrimarina mediterranea TaxID=2528022 RepID=A0A518KAA5_9BACT|nr:HAMP domain-containing sensor histidine kinase [Botrimarina mediterranea]QDV74716.1 Sensor kinase CusS [Botrimarina mediterranea]